MTFQNLREYCETQYKKSVELNKKKQECPACGHKTFSFYGENLNKAKCFHPQCNLHLNLNIINYGVDYKVIVAEKACKIFKEKLFSKEHNNRNTQAYIYCNETRKISEVIMRLSDIGTIPLEYDVNKENEDLINGLQEKIDNESDYKKKENLQGKLKDLLDFISKFQQFINTNYGKLIFIYRDKNDLITQIKSRKPYLDTKTFQILKVQKSSGVFNANMLSSDETKSYKEKKMNNAMIIFEGEFDQLTFATWGFNNLIPIQSCALGGANGDIETALKLSNKPCIFYDNDEAGISVLEKAKTIKPVFGITTPEGIKDIDEYINSFKDEKECREQVCELLKKSKRYLRDYSGIKAEITNLMKNSKFVNLDKYQLVALTIIKELLQRGKFFKDENFSYIFLDDDKKVIPIINTNEQLKRLLNRMGVNAAKDYYNYVINELSTFAFDNGAKIETHNFCHYDRKNNALFISNNDTTVYKITPESIDELENGDEGIMFNYKPEYEPFNLVDIDSSIDYFQKYVLDSMNVDIDASKLTDLEYKTLLRLWFFSTFFNSIMPSKSILVAIGEKGSRKTSILRRLGIILFGSKYNVRPLPNKAEDFDTLVSNNHFVIFDNADTKREWLNDKLASVATGQTIEKRRLYTDNESIKLPTKTYLALTSRTPGFVRDDVSDRLIGIDLIRVEDYIPEDEVMSDVINNRNEIMTYVIYELQKILKTFEITKTCRYRTKFRIADFAIFGLRIFDSLGKKEDFENILEKVCEAQKAFAVEEDSLVYILKIFAKKQLNPRKISGFELYKQLLVLADEEYYNVPEFKSKYKSVKSFTRRIANIKGNISNDVKITIYKERSNQKSYKVELMDKDFELPPTQNDLFDKGIEKAGNLEGGNHE